MKNLWKVLSLTLLLILSVYPLHAQADLPPVLNPSQFLADGIELVNSTPILNNDDSTRTFFYFDGTAWKTYPYPAGLDSAGIGSADVYQRSDGTYVIDKFSAANQTWIFDPRNGKFAHTETACGLTKDLPGEGAWILYHAAEDAPLRLCFTETGVVTPPLSADLHPEACSDFELLNKPILSPDGQWLVFSDCGSFPQPISLYAYNLGKDQLVYLGSNARDYWGDDTVEIERWVDSTHPIVQTYSWHTPPVAYDVLIADVTQANSLRLVVEMESQWPLNRPDDLEWFPRSQFGMPGPNTPGYCQLHRFDLKTETLTVLPVIPGVCGGIPIPDGAGDYLYRSVTPVETGIPKTATLVRFNPLTGQKSDLFSGEIEWLQSISPDGRYALLILDNNGHIEYPFDWEPEQYPWDQDPSAWSAIFDLQTGRVIYTLPGVANTILGNASYIDWLNNKQILVSPHGWGEFTPLTDASIVTLKDPTTQTPIDGGIVDFFGENGLLLRQESGGKSQISLYDIATGKYQPITQMWDNTQYTVDISPQQGNTLELTVSDAKQPERFVLAKWLIRIA